jgi:hypothetical protein
MEKRIWLILRNKNSFRAKDALMGLYHPADAEQDDCNRISVYIVVIFVDELFKKFRYW